MTSEKKQVNDTIKRLFCQWGAALKSAPPETARQLRRYFTFTDQLADGFFSVA